MSDHSHNMVKHLDIGELEDLGFDLNDKQAKDAVSLIISNYDQLMSNYLYFII